MPSSPNKGDGTAGIQASQWENNPHAAQMRASQGPGASHTTAQGTHVTSGSLGTMGSGN